MRRGARLRSVGGEYGYFDTSERCASAISRLVASLLGRILDAEVAAFGASGVVWTAGNNDGPHNAIFHAQDASTVAWAWLLLYMFSLQLAWRF